MKVTAIKQQAKRTDRYAVFIDGAYAFSISETALLEMHIAAGQILDANQLKAYKKQATDDKLYQSALRFVLIRPRSEGELEAYLRQRKGADSTQIKNIQNKMRRLGLVDDLEFARSWVENRRYLRSVSKRRLAQELRQKQINADIITTVLAADTTDDQTVLKELVAKKRKLPKYRNDEMKLKQYLARQGFTYDDITSVLSQ